MNDLVDMYHEFAAWFNSIVGFVVDTYRQLNETQQISVIGAVAISVFLYAWVKTRKPYGYKEVEKRKRDDIEKVLDEAIKKHWIEMKEESGGEQAFRREIDTPKMGTSIVNGVTSYSRRFSQSPAAIEKRASEFTKEEAWEILRSDFWDTKRKYLRRFLPKIYHQIIYWEKHLEEYNFYMGMKFVFDLPYEERDFWVRRRKK